MCSFPHINIDVTENNSWRRQMRAVSPEPPLSWRVMGKIVTQKFLHDYSGDISLKRRCSCLIAEEK